MAHSVNRIRIKKRQPKTWKARALTKGVIRYYNDFSHVDITQGEWLMLAASTNYMLTDMYEWIKIPGPALRAPRTTEHLRSPS
jgi:hypothetical protein